MIKEEIQNLRYAPITYLSTVNIKCHVLGTLWITKHVTSIKRRSNLVPCYLGINPIEVGEIYAYAPEHEIAAQDSTSSVVSWCIFILKVQCREDWLMLQL